MQRALAARTLGLTFGVVLGAVGLVAGTQDATPPKPDTAKPAAPAAGGQAGTAGGANQRVSIFIPLISLVATAEDQLAQNPAGGALTIFLGFSSDALIAVFKQRAAATP